MDAPEFPVSTCQVCGQSLGNVFNIAHVTLETGDDETQYGGPFVHVGKCTDQFWAEFREQYPDALPED